MGVPALAGRAWTRQPGQFIPLGYRDSLRHGLLYASGLTALDGRRAPTDYVAARQGSRNSAVTVGTHPRFGVCSQFNGSAEQNTGVVDLNPHAFVSVTLCFQLTSVGSLQVLAEYSTNYNSNGGFLIYSDTTMLVCSLSDGAGSYSEHQSAVLSADTPYVLTMLCDRLAVGQFGVRGVYLNGALQTRTGGATSFGGGNFAANHPIYLGARSGPNFGMGGVMGPVMLHTRRLSEPEILMLHENPWRVLAPQQRLPYGEAAAPPAGQDTTMFLGLFEGEG